MNTKSNHNVAAKQSIENKILSISWNIVDVVFIVDVVYSTVYNKTYP